MSDPSGNQLDADGNGVGGDSYSFGFYFMQADANHDATVNLLDFNIVAGNFNHSPLDFTQGDFNYDGVVNLIDFNILAARFNTSLGASGQGERIQSKASTAPAIVTGTARRGATATATATPFAGTRIGTLPLTSGADASSIATVVLDQQTGRLRLLN